MRKGLIVHPEEFTEKWIDRAAAIHMDVIGIHPAGGKKSYESLKELVKLVGTPSFRAKIDYARSKGLEIEYEMHAAAYLLDRGLFTEHPEFFRMNEKGDRVPDYNFCVSNPDALRIVSENAAALAGILYGSNGRFYFWLDDGKNIHCQCEKCRNLSASDQQLIAVNAMLSEIRKANPDAKLSYLAYYDSLAVPASVKPLDGVFLEYAPLEKCVSEDADAIAREAEALDAALGFFGRENAKVLEYWLDNSMFSKWKKPPVRFSCSAEPIRKDIQEYAAKGIQSITTFACFLGEDYEALYGAPDVTPYGDAFQ